MTGHSMTPIKGLSQWASLIFKSREEASINRKNCPSCGSTTGLRKYIYGMPDGPVDESKYLIGGCCITGNDPTHECIECGHQIFKKPNPDIFEFEGFRTH